MKVISSERQTGKTTKLILRADELNDIGVENYIITPYEQRAKAIMQQVIMMKERGEISHQLHFPICHRHHNPRSLVGWDGVLLVDDVDVIIDGLFPYNRIDTVTITSEDNHSEAIQPFIKCGR